MRASEKQCLSKKKRLQTLTHMLKSFVHPANREASSGGITSMPSSNSFLPPIVKVDVAVVERRFIRLNLPELQNDTMAGGGNMIEKGKAWP